MKKKGAVLIIFLVLFVSPLFPTIAQDDGCQPDLVVATFAEAVTSGDVSSWKDDYLNGTCPDPIKFGVRALVSTYDGMRTSVAPSEGSTSGENLPDITVAGEKPVVQFANVLGVGDTIEVNSSGYYDSQQCSTIPGAVVEIAPRVFVTAPITQVRQITQSSQGHSILYTDGQEMTGNAVFSITGSNGQSYDVSGVSQFNLISLPEADATATPNAQTETALWQVELPDLSLTFTGTNPDFRYRWAGCNVTVIGGSPFGASAAFNFAFNDQELRVNISDFSQISSIEGVLTVMAPTGQQTAGRISLGTDRRTSSNWFLRLNIGGQRTIWVASSVDFVLRNISG